MYCSECGKPCKDGARFCMYCGSRLEIPDANPAEWNSKSQAEPVNRSSTIEPVKQVEKVPQNQTPLMYVPPVSQKTSESWWSRYSTSVMMILLVGAVALLLASFVSDGSLGQMMEKKYALNESMDFGDFTITFTEDVHGMTYYDLGSDSYRIFADSGKQLYGLAGVISATSNASVDLESIENVFNISDRFGERTLKPYAAYVDQKLLADNRVKILTPGKSAYILFAKQSEEDRPITEATLTYTDSHGKTHKHTCNP